MLTAALTNFLGHDNREDRTTEFSLMAVWAEFADHEMEE